ncbi:hypothetical protein NE237_017566 [Protea cynaroides]|uniref:Uncharacterized protein n=1 Tax=Protea cynaroides TaxID=273540 RepID=A0A9Q0K8A2_9MAGN|nr:hypothetical protein NE237_017566 [Protea cynaroides]
MPCLIVTKEVPEKACRVLVIFHLSEIPGKTPSQSPENLNLKPGRLILPANEAILKHFASSGRKDGLNYIDFKLVRRIGSGDIRKVYFCSLRSEGSCFYAMKRNACTQEQVGSEDEECRIPKLVVAGEWSCDSNRRSFVLGASRPGRTESAAGAEMETGSESHGFLKCNSLLHLYGRSIELVTSKCCVYCSYWDYGGTKISMGLMAYGY